MALKIGVMGGATGIISRAHLAKAHELGRAIAKSRCVLITGACPGLPLAAACGAKQAGGMVVGISPGLSLDEHKYKYQSPTEFHDVLIFTGSGLMGREVVNIRSSDIVVIIGGRSGTLGELAIAYDEGKLIGVLTGTGGISDLVADILAACAKDTGSQMVYDAAPQRLVKKLLSVYRTSHFRRPSCFCQDRPPGEEIAPHLATQLGTSFVAQMAPFLIAINTLTAKLALGDTLAEGHRLLLHPLAFAGWLGLLVTALNLLPIGQLDGGHIADAMFGRARSAAIGTAALFALEFLGLFVWSGLLTWAFIVYFIAGGKGLAPLNDISRMSAGRQAIGAFAFVLLFLILAPVPHVL